MEMELELSPTKNVCVASRAALATAAASKLPKLHFKTAEQAKTFGAAISAGRERNVAVLNKRVRNFRAGIDFFKKARKSIGPSAPMCFCKPAVCPLLCMANSPVLFPVPRFMPRGVLWPQQGTLFLVSSTWLFA